MTTTSRPTHRVIAFFNNKGGVGKTSLVYHVAWMLAGVGYRVVAADLDPQANLTSAFLDEEQIEQLWTDSERRTIWGAIEPFQEGAGPIADAELTRTQEDRLVLLPGDLALSAFEDDLSREWLECLGGKARAFRIISAFHTVLTRTAERHDADYVLVDVGPTLGAINRAALVASDHVVIPVAADLFSLQGLHNLGPTLRTWRTGWGQRLTLAPRSLGSLPQGTMNVLGYIVLGHGVRLDRPVKAYQRWMDQIPGEFRSSVLDKPRDDAPTVAEDKFCLARLKHYHSLLPLGQEARKPIFALKPADGAFGGHAQAALNAYADFKQLAAAIVSAAQSR
jgi:cellulose biosynthesis protein BcsQ